MPAATPIVVPIIDSAARAAGVDGALLRAVAFVESAYDPAAVSAKGARGLFQLMPETARELGVTDPHDPTQAAAAAARYIKRLLARYAGDVSLALAAYNWGMGHVSAAIESGRAYPKETRDYIARVLARQAVEARALGGGAPNPTPAPPPAAPLPSTKVSQFLSARCARCGFTCAIGESEALRAAASLLIQQALDIDSGKGKS